MIRDVSGFGRDGDRHDAFLDTEEDIGVTIEFIDCPRGRVAPEKVYPPQES